MAGETLRILSDIHYGEHASRVASLRQLRPLFEGATALLLNGDVMDTRQGPHPERTAAIREEVDAFFGSLGLPVTFLTGNHDPDFSPHTLADLAGGQVFVTHGDILYADIVPWSQDSPLIGQRIQSMVSSTPNWPSLPLEERLRLFRIIAAAVPQRHQGEPNRLKYALRFARDTLWPPTRILKVVRAWRELPSRAGALLERDRPRARFALLGHTHRPGIWRLPSGATIINTGAYCWPSASMVVDLSPGRLAVRRVVCHQGEYRLAETAAVFDLVA